MNDTKEQLIPEYMRYKPYQRLGVLIGIMLGLILVAIDATIINVAIPTMMGNLGATMDQITWVSIGYMLTNVIFLPMTGWLEARYGRRKLLVFSVITFTVTSFLCGTATSLGLLIFYRVLQGVGGAALMSTGMSTMLDVYPSEKAGIVSAVCGVGVMVGPALGPIIGGYLVDNYSWPWIFYINVIPGIIAAIILWSLIKEPQTPGDTDKPIDISGIIWLSIWLGCLQILLEKGERQGWLESDFIKWLAILSVIGMILFIHRVLTTRYPIVNLRILRNKALSAGCVCSFITGVGLFSTMFVLPVFLQNLRGYTAQQSGVIMLVWAISSTLSMMISGVLSTRISARLLVTAGIICCFISLYALTKVTYLSGPEHIFLPQVFLGTGIGLLAAPLMTATLGGLTGNDLGDGSGLFNMVRQLGGTIGISLISTILTQRMKFHTTMIAEHVTIYNPETLSRFNMLQHFFMGNGSPIDTATQRALAVLNQSILGQSVLMSYNDLFLFIALAFALALPFVFFLRDPKPDDSKVQVSMH
ncbi:DHA2 family efflux MFS transporter permease subunit [bacterium]|nr:DHA2 family efflux MFS transporter permease subunit [bacterium]